MFSEILNNFIKKKEFKCLLITPPLLDPRTFYIAMPVLLGQLKANGYKGENLDLNIKFFNKILTKEFLEKTQAQLKKKNIEYDREKADFVKANIEQAITIYKKEPDGSENFLKSEEIINSALKLISLQYKNFRIERFNNFENSFLDFKHSYKYLKEKTTDKEQNIFIDFYEEYIKKEIKKGKYDFIAITVPFIGALIPAMTLSRLLKKMTKSYITLGGNFIKPQDVLNNTEILEEYCDSIMFGDGEESIVQMVKSIENKRPCSDVDGVMYKNEKKEIINTEPKIVKNMNNVAIMSLDGINFDDYYCSAPNIYVIISKGCYWGKCTFCSLGPKYRQYRIKPPKKVVNEIKELVQNYPQHGWIQFQDDALPPAYLSKLADEIIKENLKISYSIFARFEKEFTKELFEKLYKSGLRSVYWGLESGCQSVLDKMNKGIRLENVSYILKTCYDIGISNMAGVIVNFPTETIEENDKTIEYLKTILPYVTISPGQYSLMKNSYIYNNIEKYGLKIKEIEDFSYDVSFEDINLSPQEKLDKWNKFCNCVKDIHYKIDTNKNL